MSNTQITLRGSDHIRAFALSFSVIWGATPLSNEVNNLAYFRALTCFIGSEYDDLEDRRKLMYQYLSNDFATDSEDDTINQLYRVIPIEEFVNRVLRNLCGLYSKAPNRKFDVSNSNIDDAYKNADVNSSLRYAHKIAKLCNTALVMPVVRDFKIEIDVLPPDLFRVVTDKKDHRKITELWIPVNLPDAAGNPVYTFKVWTDKTYRVLDAEGREISSEANKYGIIPACFLQFTHSRTDFYGGGLWELLFAVLDDNKLCFLANNDVVYSAFSVWIATNFGKENIKLAPNRLLRVDKVTSGEGFEVAPSLDSVGGNGIFPNIDDLRDRRYKIAMRKMGLPESLISANPGLAPSGVAMQIDRMELLDLRSEDAGTFTKFENDFYPVFAKIVNKDLGLGLPETCSVGIDYIEDAEYIEPAVEQANTLAQFEYGLLSAKDFVAKHIKNELITTDEEAINYLIKNRTLLEKLKSHGQQTTQQALDEDSTSGSGQTETAAIGQDSGTRSAII